MKQAKHFLTILTVATITTTAFMTIISACKKDPGTNTGALITAEATVLDEGLIAADGCGWVIKINSSNSVYSPVNLAAAYQKNNSQVNVSYYLLTTKIQCGTLPENGVTQIKLVSIK